MNAPSRGRYPSQFDDVLRRELEALAHQSLLRRLRRVDQGCPARVTLGGVPLINFASNDYLGLASHPALRDAALRAVEQWGAGCGASRLISGSIAPHHHLEEALAAWKGTEAAVSFSSGYATALGTLPALVGKSDVVILDRRVHACIVDAARLSGAKLRVFKHNDVEDLERILDQTRTRSTGTGSRNRPARILIVTESVFSMDGDTAPLSLLVELKDRHGAWLMIDEAHAAGLYGPQRRGLIEEAGVTGRVEIQMGTLGKALGSAGGYICGSRPLVDLLINRARSFVFSTAPVPAAAMAAQAAVSLIQTSEGAKRRERLWEIVNRMREAVAAAGWPVTVHPSAIIPLMLGEENRALDAAETLAGQGIFAPAIRYPAVPRSRARLRLTASAAHTDAEIARLLDAVRHLGEDLRRNPSPPPK